MTDEPPKPPDEPPNQEPSSVRNLMDVLRQKVTDESPDASQQQRDAKAGGVPASAHFQYEPGTPAAVVGVQQAVQIWQSPFPPPDAIERYEKVCPGAFDRILAERLQAAQINQAETNAQFAQKDTRRGHWLGFAVAIVALVAAPVCLLIGNPWVAGLCLGVPVLSVAKALVDTVRAK
jgi:uncharacterized membrane protein